MEIAVSGQTGGTYVEYGQTNGGLVGGARCEDGADARLDSAAYQELRTLLLFYKNNGRNYYSGIQTIKRTQSTFQPPPIGDPMNPSANIVVTGNNIPANPPLDPDINDQINRAAALYGVDPNVMRAIIFQESKWDTQAENHSPGDEALGGAWGMGQMTLDTAISLFQSDSLLRANYPQFINTPITGPNILNSVKLQADLTAALLRQNIARFPNSLPKAISVYNTSVPLSNTYHLQVLKYLQYQTIQIPPADTSAAASAAAQKAISMSLIAPAVSANTINASVLYNARRIRTVGYVMIAFDDISYFGHFTSFEFFDTADHPYWFEYSFTFRALQVLKMNFTTKDLYRLGHAVSGV
jgi:hypothetical protein